MRRILSFCSQSAKQKRILKALQFSVDSSHIMIFYLDVVKDKLFIYKNGCFHDTGYNSISMMDYIHHRDRERVKHLLAGQINGTLEELHTELSLFNSTTQQFEYYDCAYRTEFGRNGLKTRKIYCSLRNIDENKRHEYELEETSHQLQVVSQATDISVWSYDTNLNEFTTFSSEKNAQVNIGLGDFMSKVHPEDKKDINSLIDVLKARRDRSFNIEVRMSFNSITGEWRDFSISGIPSKIDSKGNVSMYSGYTKDITTEKKLGMQLKIAQDKAVQVENLKNAFIANVNHNIRTPLNAIIGFTQMLDSCSTDEEKNVFYNIIQENNNKLLGYIDNLLEISSIESGYFKLIMETFDVSGLYQDIYSRDVAKMKEKVELEVSIPIKSFIIEFDRHRMEQLITLTLNEVINCTSAGKITFGFFGTTEGVEIYCTSAGDHSYNYDNRSDDQTYENGNYSSDSYLGINICESITKKISGFLDISNNKDGTLTFTINIPCRIVDVTIE